MKPILLDLPVPIITPRLILRPPKIGDGIIVNEAIIESFTVLNEFMSWAKAKPSIEESEELSRQAAANWILKNNDEPYLPLFMFDKETNQFIGATGYHHYDWEVPSIETGYWIRNSCAGKGFMTEAVNAITQYAFKQLGVKRITITCDIDNLRSKKIPERLGFSLEATLKGNRRKPSTNKITDTIIYTRYDLNNLPDLVVTWEDHNE
jgi:RimJ/RimL family protein N-acetyltransferase